MLFLSVNFRRFLGFKVKNDIFIHNFSVNNPLQCFHIVDIINTQNGDLICSNLPTAVVFAEFTRCAPNRLYKVFAEIKRIVKADRLGNIVYFVIGINEHILCH